MAADTLRVQDLPNFITNVRAPKEEKSPAMKSFAFTLEIEGADLTDKTCVRSLHAAGFAGAKIVSRDGTQKLRDKAKGPSRKRVEADALQRVCGALPGVRVMVSAGEKKSRKS